MRRSLAALAVLTLMVANACGGDATSGSTDAPGIASPSPSPSPSPTAMFTIDPQGELCQRVGEMQTRMATLQTVQLTRENRTSMEIELDKLQAAHIEVERADLGDREDELEDSLKRLEYRMGELKLAVEDFQTNAKARRAAPHVEEDAQKVVDELNAFVVLSGCSAG